MAFGFFWLKIHVSMMAPYRAVRYSPALVSRSTSAGQELPAVALPRCVPQLRQVRELPLPSRAQWYVQTKQCAHFCRRKKVAGKKS
jgi:hypothetical protein